MAAAATTSGVVAAVGGGGGGGACEGAPEVQLVSGAVAGPEGEAVAWVHATVLRGCVHVWAGAADDPPRHELLYAAMPPAKGGPQSGSHLLVAPADDRSDTMAKRLAARLGVMVLLSCSLPEDDPSLAPNTERFIFRLLKDLV